MQLIILSAFRYQTLIYVLEIYSLRGRTQTVHNVKNIYIAFERYYVVYLHRKKTKTNNKYYLLFASMIWWNLCDVVGL